MEGLWRTQYMVRRETFQDVPATLIVILSFSDTWAGERCPAVLFTCASSISSPPTLFSAHSNLVSSPATLPLTSILLNLMDVFQFPSYLFLSLSLCFTTFSWLLSLCAPPACPAAPFWLLFGFLFFQCPLNDGISWRSIWNLNYFHSACALSNYIHFEGFNYHLYTMDSQISSSCLSFELQTHIFNRLCHISLWLL